MASTKARFLKHDFPVHGKTKAQKIQGNLRSIFREKIRASKKDTSCQLRSADVPPQYFGGKELLRREDFDNLDRGNCALVRGPKTHPKSRNTKKKARLRELFRKVRANFCLLPCDASQEPNVNCSDELVQMNFFILGGFFRVDFLSVALPAEPRGEKKLFFVQILGGEKLLKFGEKWAVKNF